MDTKPSPNAQTNHEQVWLNIGFLKNWFSLSDLIGFFFFETAKLSDWI